MLTFVTTSGDDKWTLGVEGPQCTEKDHDILFITEKDHVLPHISFA